MPFILDILVRSPVHMHGYNLKQSQLYGLNYILFLEDVQIIYGISLHFFF